MPETQPTQQIPDDIFDEAGGSGNQAAQSEAAYAREEQLPAQNNQAPMRSEASAEQSPTVFDEAVGGSSGSKSRAWLFAVAGIIGVLAIIAGGYYVFRAWFQTTTEPLLLDEGLNATPGAAQEGTAPPSPTEQTEQPSALGVLQAPSIDSDGDGLTDVEEQTAGTNPQASDSDEDGLTDFDEVKIYATNPLLADTDGDSFKDGTEVRNGYDPKGPGKLFVVPQE